VSGILLALESEDAVGQAVNLGTGRPTTVNQVAEVLRAGLDVDASPELTDKYRAGDIRHCYADAGRAREVLGFQASVSLEDGFRDLLAWLTHQEAVDRVDAATDELAQRGLAR
jgi:dTDP-L-rhamnose 4-epimerase